MLLALFLLMCYLLPCNIVSSLLIYVYISGTRSSTVGSYPLSSGSLRNEVGPARFLAELRAVALYSHRTVRLYSCVLLEVLQYSRLGELESHGICDVPLTKYDYRVYNLNVVV